MSKNTMRFKETKTRPAFPSELGLIGIGIRSLSFSALNLSFKFLPIDLKCSDTNLLSQTYFITAD